MSSPYTSVSTGVSNEGTFFSYPDLGKWWGDFHLLLLTWASGGLLSCGEKMINTGYIYTAK